MSQEEIITLQKALHTQIIVLEKKKQIYPFLSQQCDKEKAKVIALAENFGLRL